ncbi:MAG: hypothetical protein M3Z85_00455, partial [Acidobacteriota bacterium]|nr:hypothetical protein [Acidobacteriota bacterium]
MSDGYAALRDSAAVFDLSSRGRIHVTGGDRARLLHAMTTNHVQQLQPGTGQYTFFLNAQGRIMADATLFCFEDRILLDTEPETREQVFQHLDKFIIADDVTLDDATDRTFALGVEGPQAAELLRSLDAPTPETPYSHMPWGTLTVARESFTGAPGFRIFGDLKNKPEFAITADPEDARIVRLEHFKPRYGEDILPTTLPQETTISKALHFQKGCY